MNVCLYALYKIVNNALDHVMFFSKALCMSPQRFRSWYGQLCAVALPAVVAVPQVTTRGSASFL